MALRCCPLFLLSCHSERSEESVDTSPIYSPPEVQLNFRRSLEEHLSIVRLNISTMFSRTSAKVLLNFYACFPKFLQKTIDVWWFSY